MPDSTSFRQLADVLSVVCDAVYDLVADDDFHDAIRRINEAASNLDVRSAPAPREVPDPDGIAAALRGVKHLSRAMEALAADAIDRAEMQIDSAVGALRASADMLKTSYGESTETKPGDAAVQLSVTEALRVPNEEAVADALKNLLNRTESDAFVIFVDAQTGNFIQFLGSKSRPLVLELPLSALSEEEVDRVSTFFASKGVEDVRGEESFSVTLGRDPARATELVLGIFADVYMSKPDFSLKIEEN